MKSPKIFAYLGTILLILVLAVGFQLIRGPAKGKVTAPSEPVWLPYHEGVEKAQAENKYILVDFYTDWCTYCKKMDKEVFAQESIKRRLRNSFAAVKVNAEASQKIKFMGKEMAQKDLAKTFNVHSYPTIWFLDSRGEPIAPLPGYLEADKFAVVLDYISGGHYKTTAFSEYARKNAAP